MDGYECCNEWQGPKVGKAGTLFGGYRYHYRYRYYPQLTGRTAAGAEPRHRAASPTVVISPAAQLLNSISFRAGPVITWNMVGARREALGRPELQNETEHSGAMLSAQQGETETPHR